MTKRFGLNTFILLALLILPAAASAQVWTTAGIDTPKHFSNFYSRLIAVDGNGRAYITGVTASTDDSGLDPIAPASVGDVFIGRLEAPAPAAPLGTCVDADAILFDGGPAGTGTAWGTAANWENDTLPTASDNVCINGFNVTVGSGSQNAGTLRVQGAGSLTINGGTLRRSCNGCGRVGTNLWQASLQDRPDERTLCRAQSL